MAADAQEKPKLGQNPGDRHYDEEFNKPASSPDIQKSGERGDAAAREYAQAGESGADKPEAAEEAESKNLGFYEAEKPNSKKAAAKTKGLTKKGARKAIIGLVMGGGALAGLFTMLPNMFVGQIQSILGKISAPSISVQEARGQLWIRNKIFGGVGNATSCSRLTYRCKITSLSESEMKVLKDNGFDVLDKDGRTPLKPDNNNRYRGGYYIKDAATGRTISADLMRNELIFNERLRTTFAKIYPSRIALFRDNIAAKILGRDAKTRNPKLTEGNENADTEEGRAKNASQNMSETLARSEATSGVDADLIDPIEEQIESEKASIEDGKPQSGISSIDGVVNAPEVELPASTNIKRSIISGLSPGAFDIAQGMCVQEQRIERVVGLARKLGAAVAITFAGTVVIATIERAMSNDESLDSNVVSNDVSMLANIFGKADADGHTAYESAGYQSVMYEEPPALPVSSAITGGTFLTILVSAVMFTKAKGFFENTVSDVCKFMISPELTAIVITASVIAQIAIAVTTAGTGTAASAGSSAGLSAVKAGIQTIVKKTVEEGVKEATKMVAESMAKSGLKGTAKATAKDISKVLAKKLAVKGAQAGAIITSFMVVGFLIDQYAVPYIAKMAAGTLINPESSGVEAGDTLVMGLGNLNASTGLGRGLQVMTKSQALAFYDYSDQKESEYASYRKRISNPFDIKDPYSTFGSIALKAQPRLAKLNTSSPSFLASLPINLMKMFTSSTKVSANEMSEGEKRLAIMNTCEDADIITDRDIATDIFCNPVVGFPDTGMLENKSTVDVYDYMRDNNQVDDDGNPVPDSEYAKFKERCVDGTIGKSISLAVDEESQIDEECLSPSYNSREDVKYFRLMSIDKSVDDGLAPTENSQSSPSESSGGASSGGELASGTAKQLAQQLLDNPNITFYSDETGGSYDGKADMRSVAKTGYPLMCGTRSPGAALSPNPMNPKVLAILQSATSKWKIKIGVISGYHSCDVSHTAARAVDLNGATALDGSCSTNFGFSSGADRECIKKFSIYLDQIGSDLNVNYMKINQVGPGNSCGMSAPLKVSKGYSDACNHLHIDAR